MNMILFPYFYQKKNNVCNISIKFFYEKKKDKSVLMCNIWPNGPKFADPT